MPFDNKYITKMRDKSGGCFHMMMWAVEMSSLQSR